MQRDGTCRSRKRTGSGFSDQMPVHTARKLERTARSEDVQHQGDLSSSNKRMSVSTAP